MLVAGARMNNKWIIVLVACILVAGVLTMGFWDRLFGKKNDGGGRADQSVRNASTTHADHGEVHKLGPGDILYSLPTLCDPLPAAEAAPLPSDHRALHEDDWRQIEFVAVANRGHIENELSDLVAFKKDHRKGVGWTAVYIRKEHPTPLAAGRLQFADLPKIQTAALAIGGGPPWGGVVRGGFAMSDGGDWFIYGQRTDEGQLLALAVSPGSAAPPQQFVRAVSQIARAVRSTLPSSRHSAASRWSRNWSACSIIDNTGGVMPRAGCIRPVSQSPCSVLRPASSRSISRLEATTRVG